MILIKKEKKCICGPEFAAYYTHYHLLLLSPLKGDVFTLCFFIFFLFYLIIETLDISGIVNETQSLMICSLMFGESVYEYIAKFFTTCWQILRL